MVFFFKFKTLTKIFLIFFVTLFFSNLSLFKTRYFESSIENINLLINSEIKEKFSYNGLASYYNGLTAYIVDNLDINRIESDTLYKITPQQSLVIIGHYKVMIVKNLNTSLSFDQNIIWNQINNTMNENELKIQILLSLI